MIVIGSYALSLYGQRDLDLVKDLDLVGTEEDVERFRALHSDRIKDEKLVHGHRYVFSLVDGEPRLLPLKRALQIQDMTGGVVKLGDLCPQYKSIEIVQVDHAS